jgi:hypothetical protein
VADVAGERNGRVSATGLETLLSEFGVHVEPNQKVFTYPRTQARSDLPTDLTLGRFALCHAHRRERRASKPSNRNASLSGRWMLGRITDASRLDAGLVSVANVECEVAGVRVIAD